MRKPIEPAFAQVQISEPPALATPTVAERGDGMIGIELPSGIKVTVDATIDADALSRVIGRWHDDPAAATDADIPDLRCDRHA